MKNYCKGLIFGALILLAACKKDPPITIGQLNPPGEQFICEDTTVNRGPLPPDPVWGWDFATFFGNKSVWRAAYDPVDINIIYYLTAENVSTIRSLWRYNRVTGEKMLLDNKVMTTISINKRGWLTYEKMDRNIYVIKSNGDSLKKITTNGNSLNPVWTDDGNFIYYVNDNNVANPIFKATREGVIVDTLHNIQSAIFPCKEFIYHLKLENNVFSVIQRNLNNGSERVIHHLGCSDFYTDSDNTKLYTLADNGLYETDLNTLITTKIVETNPTSLSYRSGIKRSPINGRFIGIQDSVFVINASTLGSHARIIEIKPDGLCYRKIWVP